MEAEPRVLDLTGEDLHKVMHAYGTNGIITEVEMPLDAAYDWVDVIVGFDDFMDAARFGNALASQDGLLIKLITPIAAPVPHDYFKRHQKFVRRDQSIVRAADGGAACARRRSSPSRRASRRRGRLPRRHGERRGQEGPAAGLRARPGTTRRCARCASIRRSPICRCSTPSRTISRCREDDGACSATRCRRISNSCASTARSAASGLPLVRFTTEERLDEIIRIHEDNGCPIFNPHRYTLEEGGMKQTDEVQLAFKREADPQGPAQPRQDDRLGESRLRLPRQAICSCSRALRERRADETVDGMNACPRPLCASGRDQLQRGAAPDGRRAARAKGHAVDDCDLYAEDFDPRLTRDERLDYHDTGPNIGSVRALCRAAARGRGAGALVSGLELRLPGDPERLLRPRLPARRVVRADRKGTLIPRLRTSGRSPPSAPTAPRGFGPFSRETRRGRRSCACFGRRRGTL